MCFKDISSPGLLAWMYIWQQRHVRLALEEGPCCLMGWVPAALWQRVEAGLGLPTPATRILQKGATGVLGSSLAVRIRAASPSLLTRVPAVCWAL